MSIIMTLPLLWKKAVVGLISIHFKVDNPSTKEMAKYSFSLVNLPAWALSLSDRYVLEFFRGSQEVGIYSGKFKLKWAFE